MSLEFKVSKKRIGAGLGAMALTDVIGIAISDPVVYNNTQLRFELTPSALAVLGAGAVAGGLTLRYGPSLFEKVKTYTRSAANKIMPYNEDHPRNRIGCAITTGLIALCTSAAMAIGWRLDAPNKQLIAPHAINAVNKIQERTNGTLTYGSLINRYFLSRKNNGLAGLHAHDKWKDFMTDVPPKNLEDYPAYFARKYCETGAVPIGACGEVWQFEGFLDGKPVYRGSSNLDIGTYLCLEGNVTNVDDAMNLMYMQHAPERSPLTNIRTMDKLPEFDGKEHVIGEPGMTIRAHSGGYEFIWPLFRRYIGMVESVDATTNTRGWRIDRVSNKITTNDGTVTRRRRVVDTNRDPPRYVSNLAANWWEQE